MEPDRRDHIFFENGSLFLIDQTELPARVVTLELDTAREVAEAIRRLSVRGAMAIGVAAAYGVLLGASEAGGADSETTRAAALAAVREIGAARPTARNLFWALERMEEAVMAGAGDEPGELLSRLRTAADGIARETIETNHRLVDAGQRIVPDGSRAMTICESGPLAALRYGTALGVLMGAHDRGKGIHVYACETRPLLQGARLTAWELEQARVPYTLIPDGAAGFVMQQGKVDLVITGADRIAANGDTANKVGTYALAVLARAHGIPFYIAAPGSTIDLDTLVGGDILIEERDPDEVRTCGGRGIAPVRAPVYNPAFDVTPSEYIVGMVTEEGIVSQPFTESLKRFRR